MAKTLILTGHPGLVEELVSLLISNSHFLLLHSHVLFE